MCSNVTTENSCHFLQVKEKITLAGHSWTDTQRNKSKSSYRSYTPVFTAVLFIAKNRNNHVLLFRGLRKM